MTSALVITAETHSSEDEEKEKEAETVLAVKKKLFFCMLSIVL